MSEQKERPERKEFGPVAAAASDAGFLREDFTMVERFTDMDPRDLSDHMFLTWVWDLYIMTGIAQTPEFLGKDYLKKTFNLDLVYDFHAPPWDANNVNILRLVMFHNQNWMWGVGFYDSHYHHLNSRYALGRASKKELLELVKGVLQWEAMDKQGKFLSGDNGEDRKRHWWSRGSGEKNG